ncbi:MAG: QueT transporter family protein [Clostridia bacterium]|nr:QueT transporter family protein [Clostridia bacterium]
MLTTRSLCVSAAIAALYAVLTIVLAPISYASIQLRVSEAMTILPVLMPEAIPGLTIGCLIANAYGLSSGLTTVLDVIFGTLATLIAALGTWFLRSRTLPVRQIGRSEPFALPLLSALCPVLSNALIVGAVLTVSFNLPFLLTAVEVGVGELLAVIIGLILLPAFRRIDKELTR